MWWLTFWILGLDDAINLGLYGIGYILSMLGLNGPVFEFQWGQDFIFSKTSRPALDHTQPPVQLGPYLFPGGKATEACLYPPHVAPCSYTSNPSVLLMVCQSVIFTFPYRVCIYIYIYIYTQGVTGGTDQTSGGCSLC